ncbi:glycosyltransferase family 2 protein [Candidatus Nitrosopumilus sediminis]|uniref:Putative glycosyltransferase n=1 Tax=Candidatus Nitrosopumilus sediminis TaxID=1229909 RepID=K0BGY0_9ARCH|nr:glycosyltransferase family 2 protein [Candidatus Nitrosopumilus sediminis]AFS83511.1 putative glycosyltransferase [Candidatus Nitrosopumilus sediminis]
MPFVSIIIVNWNAKNYLKGCIDSLLSQSFTDQEIILVDNASSDDSVDFVKKNYPQVKIIQNTENVGFAEGNNIGIKNSSGKIVALFNPDAVAEKDWLHILVNVVQDKPNIAAVTGKMYYLGDKYGKDAVFCTWSKIDHLSANPTNFHDDEPVSKVDYLSGAAMLVRRDVLDKIGLMDKDYFLYFEETDLCARMIRAGYDLMYIPSAIVWHAVSPLSNSENKVYYMERSRIRFALKNFDSLYAISFLFIFLGETFFIIFRDIKNRNFSRTKTRLRAIMWNLSNFKNTLRARRKHLSILAKNGTVQSYNKNLPLRSVKTK